MLRDPRGARKRHRGHDSSVWRRREPALATKAARTGRFGSRRLQNASWNQVELRGLWGRQWRRRAAPSARRLNELAPEVARHQQVSKSRFFEFDSRRLHQPSLALGLLSAPVSVSRPSRFALGLRARLPPPPPTFARSESLLDRWPVLEEVRLLEQRRAPGAQWRAEERVPLPGSR